MASCESDLLVSLRAGVDSYQAAVAIDGNRQRVARTPRDGEHLFLTGIAGTSQSLIGQG